MIDYLLQANGLTKRYVRESGFLGGRREIFTALENVSFSLPRSRTLGVVGESGSGKTTLAKIILGLIRPDAGGVSFNAKHIRAFRKDVQILFQNPYASLDPKVRIIDAIAEPLLIHSVVPRSGIRKRAEALLKTAEMDPSCLERYPSQFSGGQRQRICIARALASEPKVLVLDEPVSSLDLTIQARLLELFKKLKEELGLTYVFISHNLSLIKFLSDRVIVLKDGRCVEENSAEEIFSRPAHEYTKLLLSSAAGF